MILHPVTGRKVPPRAYAKYVLRSVIKDVMREGLGARPRWQGDMPTAGYMTERERALVNTQLRNMIKTMVDRHNLEKDRSS